MPDKPKGVALGAAEWQKAYERHVTAVGEVAFHWNLLHERLGEMFCLIVGTTRSIGMGVWYSTTNDRAQREMLLAALSNVDPDWMKRAPSARPDIEWLVNYINGTLSERRNNAVHAPCEAGVGVYEAQDGQLVTRFEIGPSWYLGNPRAKKLREKPDLVPEFEWYAETAQTLSRYAQSMVSALTTAGSSWPEKPRLPSLRLSPIHKA
jgi:hypothetical protein